MKYLVYCRLVIVMGLLLTMGGCSHLAEDQEVVAQPTDNDKLLNESSFDNDNTGEFLTIENEDQKRSKIEETSRIESNPAALKFLTAEKLFNERKYNECINVLNEIFKIDPMDLESNLLLGKVYLARGENENAINQFQKVLTINPDSAVTIYWLGLSYVRSGDFETAFPLLKQAESLDENFPEPKLTIAELYLRTGKRVEGIKMLEMLIEKWPDFVPSYHLLGTFYLSRNLPEEALETFKIIEKVAPENPLGPYYVGSVLRLMDKNEEAKTNFEKALVLSPDYIKALEQVIDIEWASGKSSAALERVKLQIQKVPDSADLQWVLGNVYFKMRDFNNARTAYINALELNPGHFQASVNLSRIFLETGHHDKAIQQFDKLLEKTTNDHDAQMIEMLKAIALESKGDMSGAERSYEKILSSNPSHFQAANNLAYLYSEHLGDNDKAYMWAKRAYETAPDNPYIMDTLGWILYKKKEYQQALELLNKSILKLGENPEVLFHLGMVHYQLGNVKPARHNLKKALEIDSGFRDAKTANQVLKELG
jgi:tetratricopeptide (TPR) repeat protein